jgi:hypothetical protein
MPANKPVKAKASKPAKPKGCTPFSVTVAILTPDDKTQINFGITKGCNPDKTAFWIIDFLLKEKNAAGSFVTRVEVHVHIGAEDTAAAEAVANAKRLSPAGLDLLETDVTDQARTDPNAPEMKSLLVETVKAGAA